MRVLVTGATGFVGNALVVHLLSKACEVIALVRQFSLDVPSSIKQIAVGDFGDLDLHRSSGFLRDAFAGVEVLVHTAARVHVMNEDNSDPFSDFKKINLDATLVLAHLAAELGVKRFVFLSSIKVNGEMTEAGLPFTPEDVYVPVDPYALSKYEAEQSLLALAKKTGMEVVIIRPPLVYGPGVKANFSSMMKWICKPAPLPFGAVHNQRSLVALDNLIDFISLCTFPQKSPKASNQVFLISDGEDVSTTQLLKRLKSAFSQHPSSSVDACLVPIPVSIMMFFAKLFGKGDLADRLFGSLQVDSSKARGLLGWKPVVKMEGQLKKTVDEYLTRMNE